MFSGPRPRAAANAMLVCSHAASVLMHQYLLYVSCSATAGVFSRASACVPGASAPSHVGLTRVELAKAAVARTGRLLGFCQQAIADAEIIDVSRHKARSASSSTLPFPAGDISAVDLLAAACVAVGAKSSRMARAVGVPADESLEAVNQGGKQAGGAAARRRYARSRNRRRLRRTRRKMSNVAVQARDELIGHLAICGRAFAPLKAADRRFRPFAENAVRSARGVAETRQQALCLGDAPRRGSLRPVRSRQRNRRRW